MRIILRSPDRTIVGTAVVLAVLTMLSGAATVALSAI